MKTSVLPLLVLAVLAASVVHADDRLARDLHRERRTVQYFVNHFVHFLGLNSAGAKKAEPKQDYAVNPLKNILMASAGPFSGFSKGKTAPAPKPYDSQYELPTYSPERPKKVENQPRINLDDASKPSRISLLPSTTTPKASTPLTTVPAEPTPPPPPPPPPSTTIPPTTDAPMDETTTVPEPESPTTALVADDQPSSSTEESSVDPALINTLAGSEVDNRDDNVVRIGGGNSIQEPCCSDENDQENNQQYEQRYTQPPVWSHATQNAYSSYPMLQYFGNNVFFPPANVPQPFQQLGYHYQPPAYSNALNYPTHGGHGGQAKSHSRVKLHDHPYDIVTYHDDTEAAASTYHGQQYNNKAVQQQWY